MKRVKPQITAEDVQRLLRWPTEKPLPAVIRLAHMLESVRRNNEWWRERPEPRKIEERAQDAIAELRRTVPEIADAYRSPAVDGFEDCRKEFEAFAEQLDKWIAAAPDLYIKERTRPHWHDVAPWILDFFREQVDPTAGLSPSGPAVAFIGAALELCEFPKTITGGAVEQFLRREQKKSTKASS